MKTSQVPMRTNRKHSRGLCSSERLTAYGHKAISVLISDGLCRRSRRVVPFYTVIDKWTGRHIGSLTDEYDYSIIDLDYQGTDESLSTVSYGFLLDFFNNGEDSHENV